ncbi:MAG TPA: magnesium chelatase, partial [Armatimonadota bacterium]|nr:magnesium chelatase [Armatimonadota bacterium]
RPCSRTPLAAGLAKAYDTLAPALRRDPTLRPLVLLVSDGKANVGWDGGNGVEDACRLAERLGQDRRIRWVVVDTEERHGVRLQLARRLAGALGADYFHLEDLQANDLVQVVKGQG